MVKTIMNLSERFPKRRVLIFGDSNTYGYDAESDSRYDDNTRYPTRLQAILGYRYTIIEDGLPGRTSIFDDSLNEGMRGMNSISTCMLTHTPLDTVIIMLGTNDTKERFVANCKVIAMGIAKLGQKAAATADAWRDKPDVLLISPPAIKPLYRSHDCGNAMGVGCDERSARQAEFLAIEAKARGLRFLDSGSIPGIEMNDVDGMHLTAEAHIKLAEKLAELI